MAKGNFAKEEVMKKIIECFGQDQAFIYDKKLYITTKEDGAPMVSMRVARASASLLSSHGRVPGTSPG